MWCEHSPLTLARVQIPSRRSDICRWRLLLVLSLVSRVFSSGTVLYSKAIRKLGMVDEEPFCGCAPSKLSIYGS